MGAVFSVLSGRAALTLLLGGAFLWSLFQVEWRDDLVHPGGGGVLVEILRGLVRPALAPGFLAVALEATWRTLAYATAGITLAVALALPLGILASGALIPHRALRAPVVVGARAILGLLRAIHELVWAWLFVAAMGLSPLAAVLALALPYAGILGRIYADLLNDVAGGPLRALQAAGARPAQVLLYGRLPQALPDMLSYTLYRFECGIRSAAVLSFVGLGGLGYQIQLSLDDLRFGEVWTLVFFLVALVVLVDLWSGSLRRRLVE